MFGERLVPSILIGLAIGFLLWIAAGTAMAIVALPAGSDTLGFLLGLLSSAGIGLHADMLERKEAKK